MTEATAVNDGHRRRYLVQVLAAFEQYNKSCPSGIVGALIKMAAIVGELDGRAPDISCIATTLGLPYTTVHRRAKWLEAHGYIRFQRDGRRILVFVNHDTHKIDRNFMPVVDDMLQLLLDGVDPIPDPETHTFRLKASEDCRVT